MDIVFIDKLKVPTCIGVWKWEQRIKQNLIFDIELAGDNLRAAKSDEISDAISYKEVAMRIYDFVANSKFNLLETVAEKVAELILKEFSTAWCRVKVSKPRAVENAENVGVVIERRAKSNS